MQDAMNWLARDPDQELVKSFNISSIRKMHAEIEDRFTQRLEFGTQACAT